MVIHTISRRTLIGGIAASVAAPALLRAATRPQIADGVMSGEIGPESAIVWSRTGTQARMLVEWSTTESFAKSQRVRGSEANNAGDFIAKARLNELPPGQTIFYRVRFEGPDGTGESALGRLRTPARTGGKVSFVFGGDQCGAGWGINPEWGGLRIYDTMLRTDPDFLVHLGDRIYSDNVLQETVRLDDGTIWRNLVTPAKSHAAQTLEDYRGNYRYNLIDDNVRRFNASAPQFVTWDDHEVTDDWWPGRVIDEARAKRLRYVSPQVDRLIVNGRRAFFDYSPIGEEIAQRRLLWRSINYGPLVEVFMLDQRSHRNPNQIAGRSEMGSDAVLMGRAQVDWLKSALAQSMALWKVIASPLPLAHAPSKTNMEQGYYDKFSNGAGGAPVGRESEAAEILTAIRISAIRNVVWIAADVHYAAGNEFHPDRAAFKGFDPFWEFIAGPFHTQAYAPGRLDPTFGPQTHYASTKGVTGNQSPSAGWCNFGHAEIDAASGLLTVSFRDVEGKTMWAKTLSPDR